MNNSTISGSNHSTTNHWGQLQWW